MIKLRGNATSAQQINERYKKQYDKFYLPSLQSRRLDSSNSSYLSHHKSAFHGSTFKPKVMDLIFSNMRNNSVNSNKFEASKAKNLISQFEEKDMQIVEQTSSREVSLDKLDGEHQNGKPL